MAARSRTGQGGAGGLTSAYLDYLYKGTAGIPLHDPNTKAATVARMVRDFGFLRVMRPGGLRCR